MLRRHYSIRACYLKTMANNFGHQIHKGLDPGFGRSESRGTNASGRLHQLDSVFHQPPYRHDTLHTIDHSSLYCDCSSTMSARAIQPSNRIRYSTQNLTFWPPMQRFGLDSPHICYKVRPLAVYHYPANRLIDSRPVLPIC